MIYAVNWNSLIIEDFIIGLIYFLVLYLIAFFSNLHYREEDDILFISRSQWRAIAVMWLPIIVVFMKQ